MNITTNNYLLLFALHIIATCKADIVPQPAPSIRILCTAALIQNQWELRKQEYCTAINLIKSFGYPTYIVESCSQGPTFLNDLSENVFYSQSNIAWLRNKGINEALSMLFFLEQCDFDDNDIIVKFTGRYIFTSNQFLNIVASHPEIDAFVRFNPFGEVYESCYALRFKYLKEMLYQIDYVKMEKEMINIGHEVAHYIVNIKSLPCIAVSELGIDARVASNNFLEHF
jgi:hypothetical protein